VGERDPGAAADPAAPPLGAPGPGAWLVRLAGSFFGVGLLPKAPGTWGSLAALAIYVPIQASGLDDRTFGCLLLFLLFSMAALALGGASERAAGRRDPGWFVLDEMAGVFLALFGLAQYNHTYILVGVAFLLFRLFDVLKVGAVGWVEERLPGTLGIWLDDLVAAAWANLIVRGVAYVLLRQGLLGPAV